MTANPGKSLRGWAWLVWVGCAELVLLGLQALPAYLPAPAAVTQAQPAAADEPQRLNLQPILDFQPFGASAPPAAPSAPADPASPATTLVLQGVMWRGDPASSRALVRADTGPARIYATGDSLPGGGTLSGIEVDRIWIDLDGQKRILGFPDPTMAPSAPSAGQATEDQSTADPIAPATTEAPAAALPAKPQAPKLTQPDLRHLIPGLVADAVTQP